MESTEWTPAVAMCAETEQKLTELLSNYKWPHVAPRDFPSKMTQTSLSTERNAKHRHVSEHRYENGKLSLLKQQGKLKFQSCRQAIFRHQKSCKQTREKLCESSQVLESLHSKKEHQLLASPKLRALGDWVPVSLFPPRLYADVLFSFAESWRWPVRRQYTSVTWRAQYCLCSRSMPVRWRLYMRRYRNFRKNAQVRW